MNALFSLQVSGVAFDFSRRNWFPREPIFLLDATFPNLPPFLRIGVVEVREDFQQFMPLFQQLKPALLGSRLILDISKLAPGYEKLLPLFNCCRSYEFTISRCNQKEISNLLASFLQLPTIGSCFDIEFNHIRRKSPSLDDVASLPIEAILNWLHNSVSAESIKQTGKNRSLRLALQNIGNMSEMVEHLKKVVSRNYFTF